MKVWHARKTELLREKSVGSGLANASCDKHLPGFAKHITRPNTERREAPPEGALALPKVAGAFGQAAREQRSS